MVDEQPDKRFFMPIIKVIRNVGINKVISIPIHILKVSLCCSFLPGWSTYGPATCVQSQPTACVGRSCGRGFSAPCAATPNFWYELWTSAALVWFLTFHHRSSNAHIHHHDSRLWMMNQGRLLLNYRDRILWMTLSYVIRWIRAVKWKTSHHRIIVMKGNLKLTA